MVRAQEGAASVMRRTLPQAFDGCACVCHRQPNVVHATACCGPGLPRLLDKPKPRLKYMVCYRGTEHERGLFGGGDVTRLHLSRLDHNGSRVYATVGERFTLYTRVVVSEERDAHAIEESRTHQ